MNRKALYLFSIRQLKLTHDLLRNQSWGSDLFLGCCEICDLLRSSFDADVALKVCWTVNWNQLFIGNHHHILRTIEYLHSIGLVFDFFPLNVVALRDTNWQILLIINLSAVVDVTFPSIIKCHQILLRRNLELAAVLESGTFLLNFHIIEIWWFLENLKKLIDNSYKAIIEFFDFFNFAKYLNLLI